MKQKKSNLWNRIFLAIISFSYAMGYPTDYEAAGDAIGYFKNSSFDV